VAIVRSAKSNSSWTRTNFTPGERQSATSEAAPCPLQPCYFDKWDIFADTWDCQYAMGLPLCIFNNLLSIFPISCHLLMTECDSPIFEKLFFPKIRITFHLNISAFSSNLVCNNLIIMLFFMPPTQASSTVSMYYYSREYDT
jgi:hypothetical protein